MSAKSLAQDFENPEAFYEYLKENGLVKNYKYSVLSPFISKNDIDSLGIFNHFAELCDIGFSPNDVNMNLDYYRPYYFSILMNRIVNIARDNINIKYSSFEYDIPKNVSINLNGTPRSIEILLDDEYHRNGGLEIVTNILNQINKYLNIENCSYRYLLIRARNKFKWNVFNKVYDSILNYRIILMPVHLIKTLEHSNKIKYRNELYIPGSYVSEKPTGRLIWGYALTSISEISQKENIISGRDSNWDIKSVFCMTLENILRGSKIRYDSIIIQLFSDKTCTQSIMKTSKFQDLPEDVLDQYLRVSIYYAQKEHSITESMSYLRRESNVEIPKFINTFLKISNQEFLIAQAYQDDYWSFESAKSLSEINPDMFPDFETPSHLRFIRANFYSVGFVPYFKVTGKNPDLIRLGYAIIEDRDLAESIMNE